MGDLNNYSINFAQALTQYLSLTQVAQNGTTLQPVSQITIEQWYKVPRRLVAGEQWWSVARYGAFVAESAWAWGQYEAAGQEYLWAEIWDGLGATSWWQWAWVPVINAWNHVAITIDTTQVTAAMPLFILNGVSQGAGAVGADGGVGALNANASNVLVGGNPFAGAGGQFADARMDLLRIWKDIIRTPAQINANKSRALGTTLGLGVELLFEQNASDNTVNGNDFTEINNPTYPNDPAY